MQGRARTSPDLCAGHNFLRDHSPHSQFIRSQILDLFDAVSPILLWLFHLASQPSKKAIATRIKSVGLMHSLASELLQIQNIRV